MTPRESGNEGGGPGAATDNELLERVQRHNRQAFTELYRRFQPRLLAYLNRMLASMAIADEIVDDVMFVVWRDAGKFRGESAVSSWIFGIAYRQAMSALRREARFQRPLDRSADVGKLVAPPARDLDLLGAGLAELSADHRQVVVLTYFCGCSYQEIAAIADCPVGTVKTRMFHARRRLKFLLPRLAGEKGGEGYEHG
jgi:RNA polymerase sigma-70 factor (ECF subfamily)